MKIRMCLRWHVGSVFRVELGTLNVCTALKIDRIRDLHAYINKNENKNKNKNKSKNKQPHCSW